MMAPVHTTDSNGKIGAWQDSLLGTRELNAPGKTSNKLANWPKANFSEFSSPIENRHEFAYNFRLPSEFGLVKSD